MMHYKPVLIYSKTFAECIHQPLTNNLQNVYIIKTGYTIDIQNCEHIRINMHQLHIFVPYLYMRMFQ